MASPPLNFDHLGYGGRLAGPVDNANASCLGCHQTAGFPMVPILPEFSPNGALLKLDAGRRPAVEQSFRMMYYGNVASGAVFSDTQLQSSDYSLQLAMSLQNFISMRCANTRQQPDARPAICAQLTAWSKAQRRSDRRSPHIRLARGGRRCHTVRRVSVFAILRKCRVGH